MAGDDKIKKIEVGPKSIGEASKLALAEMLLAAAKNPKSEITMDDYNNYMKTGKLNFAKGGIVNIFDMIKPVGA
jgi:DNA-binding protein YbaB